MEMEAGRQQEGVSQLQELLEEARNDSYAQAVIRQHLGYAHLGLHQFLNAYQALSLALDSGALPEDVSLELQKLLAQVALQLGRPKIAFAHLEVWLHAQASLAPEEHAVAAQIYYAAARTSQAITHLEQAIASSIQPPEPWERSLLAMYLETKRYAEARRLLHQLILRYPHQVDYWRNLAQLEAMRQRHDRALALLASAYRKGILPAKQLTGFARLHAGVGMPEKAARLLMIWRKSGDLPTTNARLRTELNLWRMARERDQAMHLLQSLSAAGDGKAAYELGSLMFEEGRWSDAVSVLELPASSGELEKKEQDHANLLLGIAALQAGKPALAGPALRRAMRNPETREHAAPWSAALLQLETDEQEAQLQRGAP